ncbi:hypothetical protein F2P56_001909 [Juglans regia]|uniref:ELMO domain-containing protein n=1 Tax=Juglans regia TaxID=51240 RepID=A0A833Y0Z3_JUGRE|nr:hypothetical protein F2P56_001909 [Juglans regia]
MRLRRRRQCFPSCSSLHRVDEDEIYWRQKKGDEELEWSHSSAHIISQLTQCFANAMVGPRSWVGGLFNRSSNKRNEKFIDYPLCPLQEQRLQRLQERLQVPFEETRPDHQEALRALWHAAFPNIAFKGLISEQWKEMGWQGPNPSTDFSDVLSLGVAVLFPLRICCFLPGLIRHLSIGYCSSKEGSELLGNTHLLLLASMYHLC